MKRNYTIVPIIPCLIIGTLFFCWVKSLSPWCNINIGHEYNLQQLVHPILARGRLATLCPYKNYGSHEGNLKGACCQPNTQRSCDNFALDSLQAYTHTHTHTHTHTQTCKNLKKLRHLYCGCLWKDDNYFFFSLLLFVVEGYSFYDYFNVFKHYINIYW